MQCENDTVIVCTIPSSLLSFSTETPFTTSATVSDSSFVAVNRIEILVLVTRISTAYNIKAT